MTVETEKYKPDGSTFPAFPFGELPQGLKDLLNLSYANMNFPPEMLAAGILSAISASIGNSLKFKTPIPGYESKPSLWLCIVAPRGSRKTPAISKALKPLIEHSNTAHSEYKERLKQWESTDQKDNRPEFFSAVINDSTLEGIMKACEKNEGGVLTHADELGGFMGNFGRYNGGADMDGYNSLWNGETTVVNRKKASLSMYVENPFWTLIGGLQPTRMSEQFGRNMIESGFLDRVQFVYPSKNGDTYVNQTATPPPEVEQEWSQYSERMNHLITLAESQSGLYIRAEEPDVWMKYYNILGQLQNGTDENNPIQGLAAKAQTMFGRFSVIAHGLNVCFNKKPWLENLTNKEIRTAFFLAYYFMNSALYTYDRLKQASPVDELTEAEKALYEALPEDWPVSRADIVNLNEKSKNPIAKRTLDRFLKNEQYFTRPKWGEYQRKH